MCLKTRKLVFIKKKTNAKENIHIFAKHNLIYNLLFVRCTCCTVYAFCKLK